VGGHDRRRRARAWDDNSASFAMSACRRLLTIWSRTLGGSVPSGSTSAAMRSSRARRALAVRAARSRVRDQESYAVEPDAPVAVVEGDDGAGLAGVVAPGAGGGPGPLAADTVTDAGRLVRRPRWRRRGSGRGEDGHRYLSGVWGAK
jgi:hypothetical protein